MNGKLYQLFFDIIKKVLIPIVILSLLNVQAVADPRYTPRYHICIKKLNGEVAFDILSARVSCEYTLGYSVRFLQNLPVYNGKFHIPIYVNEKMKEKQVIRKTGLSATVNGKAVELKLTKSPQKGSQLPCPEGMKVVWYTAEITEIKSTLIESFIAELDKSNGDYEKVKEIKEKMENLKQRKKFEMPFKVSYTQNYCTLEGEKYFVYLPLLSGFKENKEECVITLQAQDNTKIKLDSSADSEIIHSERKIKVYPEDFQAVFVKIYN